MRRFSGRFRSALIIGVQGIRARKLRTLLSMVSLFLGVLAVVVVQTGASVAQRALLSDIELTSGIDGTAVLDFNSTPESAAVVLDTLKKRPQATGTVALSAIIGEPGVQAINPGGSPFDQNWGPTQVCTPDGTCTVSNEPPGQAIELQLTALTSDVRQFRPFRPQSGNWLDFSTVPALAPRLVLNREAAKGFTEHRVPAEMRLRGATTNMTPQLIGVVDDGDSAPHAYVRMDELAAWLPPAGLADPAVGGYVQILMPANDPVQQVLVSKLQAINASPMITTINSKKDQESQLKMLRLIFLAMAGLVLLIGVAGILNVGLATVGERVEEFALRRAVGTPRALLAGIVLAETLLTGLLTAAAAIGVSALGLKAASMLLGSQTPFLQNVQFPWDAGVAGIIAGLAAGVLGGFIPALRAAGIPIATVMRA
ncbi:ABC transporter permease [Actinoplanes sp. TFC3]|uniref:ABC transporter permease n=1 Tax=Actinoplanes sp. TFC3 TaxID=1710355 RepID=UPI00083200FD|nr:ABC transporter permease [Actinoplanes sp. TFC3]